MKNALVSSKYPRPYISLHWVVGLLIIGMLAFGAVMDEFQAPLKFTLFGIHKAIGIVILALVFVRVFYRATFVEPAILPALPAWQHKAAQAVHLALYVMMLAMPLSGWLMSNAAGYPVSVFGLFTMPDLVAKGDPIGGYAKEFHEAGLGIFIGLLALHIGATIQHHFLLKDNTFSRMWPR